MISASIKKNRSIEWTDREAQSSNCQLPQQMKNNNARGIAI